MKRIFLISLIVVLGGAASWWYIGGRSERSVRRTVEELAQAVESGLNRRDLSAVEPFFATEAEGAIPSGLGQTRDALRTFATQLTGSDQVQFHTFTVQTVRVHERAGLADVRYRLHFSVVRGGGVIFGGVAEQTVALLKTPRGWRVMGGDQPQLSEIVGTWPPRTPTTHG
jgi:hypothetical protein